MPNTLYVTLKEVIQVAGRPLKERSLWALLKLVGGAVQAAVVGAGGSELLITPESILLRPGGQAEVLDGVYDDGQSQFVAPESRLGEPDKEKVYVYSLGASMRVAAGDEGSSSVHWLLAAMVEKEPAGRPSLQSVLTSCAHLTDEEALAQADQLVSLVLGQVESTSSEDEVDFSDNNLESELQSAEVFFESKRGSISSLTEESRLLKRRASSRSVGTTSLARLSVSSVPAAYHLDGLIASSPQLLHRAVSLTLHSQDVEVLSCKAESTVQKHQLTDPDVPDPGKIRPSTRNTTSLPASSPSSPPQEKRPDLIYPENVSPPAFTAFQTNSLQEDLSTIPPASLHTSLTAPPHGDAQSRPLLEKADEAQSLRSLPNDTSSASFDYSDLEDAKFNRLSSAPTSEDEFELSAPSPPTGPAVEELGPWAPDRTVDEPLDASNWESANRKVEEEVEPLYATVDKTKKTSRRKDRHEDGRDPLVEAESGSEREECPPPLPPPLQEDPPLQRASGVYEEVEAHCTQMPSVDSSGYTMVVGERRFAEGLDVGYSGNGSMAKLQTVLGPEFSSMTGGKVRGAPLALPRGRRAVEVVLLNGKAVKFVAGVSATAGDLFAQVASSQSLQETHIFGLAVRMDRDDIFLDMECKLAKYAPSGWVTGHTAFTVFFRVKFYVENVSQLSQRLTRHLYYLQLRKDIMEGRMYCHEEYALRLAALAIQAERSTTTQLVRIEDYVPAQILRKLDRQSLVTSMQRKRIGLTQLEAELEFLKEAQKLPEYGMLFYRMAKTKYEEPGSVWLGFCVRGIVVFDVHRGVKTATQHCAWRRTSNISYTHRKFVIEPEDKPEPLVFFARSCKRARYLLELSKACHKFHLVWAKKSPSTSGEMVAPHCSSVTESDAAKAVVEYPSPSRPLSEVDDGTPSGLVTVNLSRGRAGSFGFSLAGSTHSNSVYVVKIVAGGVSEGQLLVGDKLRAINGAAVKSYRQALATLRECGPQVTMDVQRRNINNDPVLPQGETLRVEVAKEQGVLGVRIAGGSDKPYGRGLVRIKQVTADTAGSRSGALMEGDVILQVNSVSLWGITHRQAADAILSAGDDVCLLLHRPSNPNWWRVRTTHLLTESIQCPFLSPPPPPLSTLPSSQLSASILEPSSSSLTTDGKRTETGITEAGEDGTSISPAKCQ